MFKNQVLVFRKIMNDKINALILSMGLGIVIYCSTLVGSYMHSEYNFESHFINKDRIVKLFVNYKNQDQVEHFDITSHGLPKLLSSIPQVKETVQVYETEAVIKTKSNEPFMEDNFYYVTDNFWEVFNADFIYGLPFSPGNKFEIVISESIAKKYFNRTNVVGEKLQTNSEQKIVVGVFKDLPSITQIRYEGLIPLSNEIESFETGMFECKSFVLMHSENDKEEFIQNLAQFDSKTYQPLIEALFEDSGFSVWHDIQPIAKGRASETGYIQSDVLLGLLVLIVTILLINTGNLSFSKSLKNAKESGIKKILGVSKYYLARQSALEAIFYVFVAILLAGTLIQLTKNHLENFVDSQIIISFLSTTNALTSGIILIGFIIVFSLSALPVFNANVQSLLRKQQLNNKKAPIRDFVLGLQFAISFFVICGCWFMYSQYQYMINADIGFKANDKSFVSIPFDVDFMNKSKAFRVDVEAIPGVDKTSFGHRPGFVPFISTYSQSEGKTPNLVNGIAVDENYFDFFDIEITAGRNFLPNQNTSEAQEGKRIIINESFRKKLGFENAVGKTIYYDGKATIIGVVENFNYTSLRMKVDPLIVVYADNQVGQLLISSKTNPEKHLKSIWMKHFPNHPFNIGFLDKELQRLYDSELKLSKVLGFLALVGVLLSTIGLYAVSRNNQLARTKEIGIRKVLGATIAQIVNNLVYRILMIVSIAILLCVPITYYLSNSWMEQYQNRIDTTIFSFIIPTGILMFFVFISIGFHTYKNAIANPINSLRYE